MKKIFLILVNISLLAVIVITVFYFFTRRTEIFAQENGMFNKVLNVNIAEKVREIKREKPAEREVRGLYLTSYSASLPARIDSFINQIKSSNLNAVVIDIKDYSGQISYNSQVELVNELQTDRETIKDLAEVVKKFHDNNI